MWLFFLKNWKWFAAGATALLIFGLGLGFWSFIGGQIKAREAAEAKVAGLEQQVADLESSAWADAARISDLNARLDVEGELAKKRLSDESQRREAAEARVRKSQGLINDLRTRLEADAPVCNCGIGADLTERLRLDRAERQARLDAGN